MNDKEIIKLQEYFCQKFTNKNIKLVKREKKDDSAEVLINDEFIGVVFRDFEDGELSYDFNMAILAIDLV